MDYDSSSKFISSLAKFLQSLCNGYVEFDNGVEVIGHIYLSVDTGKKIDYILNEKVCKTDENSVTFISNSFHAQPAEKPKPNSKKGRGNADQSETVESVEIEESNNQVEPRSTNTGTVSRNPSRNLQSSSPNLGKRPFSPHSKTGASSSKKGRNDLSQDQPSFDSVSNNSNSSLLAANSSSDPLRGHPHQSSSGLPHSIPSQSFDPGYLDNSNAGNSEERDIKPSMDTDVTFVKEEFASSQAEEDRGGIDDSFSSMYSGNQSYSEGGPSSQSFGHQNSRLSYPGDRSDNGMYDNSMMSSQLEGNEGATGTDPSGSFDSKRKLSYRDKTGNLVCEYCNRVFAARREYEGHINSRHFHFKPYECYACSKSFVYKKGLIRHMNRAHLTDIPGKEISYDFSHGSLTIEVKSKNDVVSDW